MILLKKNLCIQELEEISQFCAALLILEEASPSVKINVKKRTFLFKQMVSQLREADTASVI